MRFWVFGLVLMVRWWRNNKEENCIGGVISISISRRICLEAKYRQYKCWIVFREVQIDLLT